MKIRIAGTEFSLNNRSYEIYIQGCYRNCPGCQNPQTHDFSGGKEYEISPFMKETYRKIYPFIHDKLITNIYVSGGDLLCQPEEVAERFSESLDFWFRCSVWSAVKIWLFTGCGEDERLPDWVWDYYDVVKAGTYREDMLNPVGTFPASYNQILIGNSRGKMSFEEFNGIKFRGKKIWR